MSLVVSLLVLSAPLAPTPSRPAYTLNQPMTRPQLGWEAVNSRVRDFMVSHALRGGAIAITRNGHLLAVKGYGLADVEANLPFRPSTISRIGSISKPITALAILHLVEQGKIKLSEPAWEALGLSVDQVTPQAKAFTIRQLLNHTSAWDSEVADGFPSSDLVSKMGSNYPVPRAAYVRYAFAHSTQSSSGAFAYSNLNFMALAEIVEKASGKSYESFVLESVLRPFGIKRMKLGPTRIEGREKGEARYYADGQKFGSIFPEDKGKLVERPYGVFAQETVYGAGGWIGTVVDLARILVGIDPRGPHANLRPTTFEEMISPPAPNSPKDSYGLGWNVGRSDGGQIALTHGGNTPGACCAIVHRFDGYGIAVIFNGSAESGDSNIAWELTAKIQDLFNRGLSFSDKDLFPDFP